MVRPARTLIALLAGATIAILASGCGSGKAPPEAKPAASAPTTTTPTTTTTSPAAPTGAGASVPAGAVAVVAGTRITRATFDHWLLVATKSSAQTANGPAIVPDPPGFTRCIAAARKTLRGVAKLSRATIKTTCEQLFRMLSAQVMSFLITAQWVETAATEQRVTVTGAQVRRALAAQESRQFSTPAKFQSFVRQTGQTRADLLFRVRIQQLIIALAKHEHASQSKVAVQLKGRFHARTICAPTFRTPDCAG